MYIDGFGSGFAPLGTTVTIEVHEWDYVLALLYSIILLITVVGIAKYALRTEVLTLCIMVTNFLAISCKSNCSIDSLILTAIFLMIDRFSLFVYLFVNEKKTIDEQNGHAFYYFFFELPYHCFNVVAFLLLMNWVQALLILKMKRRGVENLDSFSKLFIDRNKFNIFLTSQLVFWGTFIILDAAA